MALLAQSSRLRRPLIQVLLLVFCAIRHGQGATKEQGAAGLTRSATLAPFPSTDRPNDIPVDTDYAVKPTEGGGAGGGSFLKWSG